MKRWMRVREVLNSAALHGVALDVVCETHKNCLGIEADH